MSDTNNSLSNVMLAALDAALKSDEVKAAKGSLTVGTHEVDFTLRVKATISKGEDVEAKPTVTTPWLTVLALCLKNSGMTREASLDVVREAMLTASKLNGDAEKELLAMSGVPEMKKRLDEEVMATLPKLTKAGAVKAKVASLEVVA